MQTKRHSFIESAANTLSACFLSVAIYEWLLPAVWNIHVALVPNVEITVLFTLLSLGRNYLWRRIFNRSKP